MKTSRELAFSLCLFLSVFLYGCATSTQTSSPTPAEISEQSISFDEFISKSPGEDVSQIDTSTSGAYKAHQINKIPFRFIDQPSYYSEFGKKFKSWCAAHSGMWKAVVFSADCLDPNDPKKWIAAYRLDLTHASWTGQDMDLVYSRIRFYRNAEMQFVTQRDQSKLKARQDEGLRQRSCYDQLVQLIRTNATAGINTNLGMIVDVRPPLAQVQVLDIYGRASVRWVEINQLKPVPSNDYCQ